MFYNYLIGFIHLLNLNIPQYIFLCVFIGLGTAGFITFISFKIDSNYTRIVYVLSYIFLWFVIGGIIGGSLILLFSCILYVLIREFAGDYS